MTVHLRVHTEKQGMVPDAFPETFQYPGGEWSLRNIPDLPTDEGRVTLIASVRGADPNDLVKAALWGDVAHNANFHHRGRRDHRFVLMLPYLPAARADRGVPVGAMVYSSIVNAMRANLVIGLDPHSEYITKRIVNLRQASLEQTIAQAGDRLLQYDYIMAPDKGARARASKIGKLLGLEVVTCDKQRDFETGKITGLTVPDIDRSKRYLVVDDICDGGGTFMMLAGRVGLPKDQLGLWVTHGIFSGNAIDLRDHYGWIGTTDSHPGHNRLGIVTTIVPCFHPMYTAMTGVL